MVPATEGTRLPTPSSPPPPSLPSRAQDRAPGQEEHPPGRGKRPPSGGAALPAGARRCTGRIAPAARPGLAALPNSLGVSLICQGKTTEPPDPSPSGLCHNGGKKADFRKPLTLPKANWREFPRRSGAELTALPHTPSDNVPATILLSPTLRPWLFLPHITFPSLLPFLLSLPFFSSFFCFISLFFHSSFLPSIFPSFPSFFLSFSVSLLSLLPLSLSFSFFRSLFLFLFLFLSFFLTDSSQRFSEDLASYYFAFPGN